MSWVLKSPGRASNIALFNKTSAYDYEKSQHTDILALKESNYKRDDYAHEKFKKQLKRDEECWYEMGLVWKGRNLPSGNNNWQLIRMVSNKVISNCKEFYLSY